MSKLVVNGATLRCNQGTSPSTLTVLPAIDAKADEEPTGTIVDHAPMLNVAPFGMCTTTSNPAVAAAQGAPQPCVPVLPAPWTPGASIVTIQGLKALSDDSKCTCAWSGSIEVTDAGTDVEIE